MAQAVTTDQALSAVFGASEGGVFSGSQPRAKEAHVKYWVTREGWIGLGPDIHTDAPKYQQFVSVKGWKELPDRFGREQEYSRGASMRPAKKVVGKEHVWLQKFMEAGGITYVCQPNDNFGKSPGEYLMPAAQLVSLNLHRLPEIRAMRPDLEAATDVTCSECIDQVTRQPRRFSGVNQDEAERSLAQHNIAVHSGAAANRALVQEIGNAIKSGSQMNPEMIATIVAAVVQATKTGEVPKALKPFVQKPPAPVKPPLAEGMPDETWTRQQLMSYVAQNGVPRGEGFMALKTRPMLQHILDHLPQSLPEEDSGLQE